MTRLLPGLTALALVLAGLTAHNRLLVSFVVLFLVFTPLERLFALHPQKVLRRVSPLTSSTSQ